MAYDRDLILRAIKYTEEGHTFALAAAVFKVNITHWLEKTLQGNQTADFHFHLSGCLYRLLPQ